LTDTQGTLSIGALLVVSGATGYTVYAGTRRSQHQARPCYAWNRRARLHRRRRDVGPRVGGAELNGALIFRLAQNGSTILAANVARP